MKREIYDLNGFDAGWAFNKLNGVFRFRTPRTLKLRRGLCERTAVCYSGENESLEGIKVKYSHFGNKARVYFFYEDNINERDKELVRSLIIRPETKPPAKYKKVGQIDWGYLSW